MQIGVHGLVFTGTFDEAGLNTAISGTQAAGFDLLELPLMDPSSFDGALVRRMLDDHGVAMSASMGLDADHDLSSSDATVSRSGESLLENAIDVVAEAGGSQLCGVIYSAMQKYMTPVTELGRSHSAEALGRLGARAEAAGVSLALEIVNRYETNVVNTAREGLRFLDLVDHDNVHLHLDTYHMNIEEAGMLEPVLDAGGQLAYVHIGESHRGYLGTGTVDFGAFFRGLTRLGYDGPIVFESFSSAVVSESLSNTLGIWRNLWEDSADLAAHANRFIRDQLRAVATLDLQ
ncbi:D-psicose/D-tagatose/L-ribulose 3-epimerase [Microcella alkaliphila]|uniref:D-psicose/D-tagatose/L-ribulose 3-epimerase n=1 Tax=Microcella alkaliphila TaxID=279828 RepID=A0A4Q7TGD2_9MICO|nr:sugar phosphate isomerase/epimerase family protein [Microcella alkaliphila]RZT59521.1 D-psicose/D-tagatose/L-ribulose 3-epimerase [Microcella alkaliphila]